MGALGKRTNLTQLSQKKLWPKEPVIPRKKKGLKKPWSP